jgi:norsolorinic acid ketoreductase
VWDTLKSSPILSALPKATDSRLILIKIDLNSETDPLDAASELQTHHSITHLDVLIVNAGITHSHSSIATNTASALRDHFNANTIAPILLFQAFRSLLQASPDPKFLALSSLVGSIASQDHLPGAFSPYGASKAALNWVVKRVHVEEQWLCTYVVSPGLVLTDMSIDRFGEEACRKMGAIEVRESVEGILKGLDTAMREGCGGTFQSWEGRVLPW